MTYKYNKDLNTIDTERLHLRLGEEKDVKRVAEVCNNINVSKYLALVPHPYTEEDARDWFSIQRKLLESETSYNFMLEDKNGLIVGAVSIGVRKEHNRGEIGYWIAEDSWNKGYATEAALAMRDFGFEVLGLHKIIARHDVNNPNSGNVMKKLGMVYEGTLKEHELNKGKYIDLVYYGLIRE